MTLKDLQEEGRKEFDKQFSRMVHWHRGEVLIQNATGGFPIAKDENGNYTTNQFDAIKDFIQSQTSLAYELGKKETLDMVLKEIEGELEKNDKNGGRTMYELGAKDALDSLKQKLLQVNPREEI